MRVSKRASQWQHPRGRVGRLLLWSMNRRHARLSDWGLQHVSIHASDRVLDVGCGGGRTVAKLAEIARSGGVHGIDDSAESVATARRVNRSMIERGHVSVERASVLELPFANDSFDLVTAVETHFWWGDLAVGMREVFRVLKERGCLMVVADFYEDGRRAKWVERLAQWTRMAVLDVEQHREMLTAAGFTDVEVAEEPSRGWISAVGRKP